MKAIVPALAFTLKMLAERFPPLICMKLEDPLLNPVPFKVTIVPAFPLEGIILVIMGNAAIVSGRSSKEKIRSFAVSFIFTLIVRFESEASRGTPKLTDTF